jgi:hypothetical protein
MNSQLVMELAKEAGLNPYNYMGGNLELIEKLTELVVRQCISIADKHGEYEVMDSMFEHFGINDRS